MELHTRNIVTLIFLLSTIASCIKEVDLSEEHVFPDPPGHLYPFRDEARNVTSEIIIKTNANIAQAALTTKIPTLKYNK